MKKSEMLNKLTDVLIQNIDTECDIYREAEIILSKLEKLGMQPPETFVEDFDKDGNLQGVFKANVWDNEKD